MDLAINISVMPSLLTRPLLEGEVRPEGLTLDSHEAASMDELSRRMLNREFDVGEMAISTFTKARALGVPLTGLPLFTSGRRFVQAGFQTSRRAGISDPSALRGKRVGMSQYWMSSSVWQRKILQDLYGVAPAEVHWVTVQPERLEELSYPAGVEVQRDTSGRTLRELMEASEIDAILSPGGGRDTKQGGDIIPMFPDNLGAQREYYTRTRIFPIMHVTLIREDLARNEPWVVQSLCNAYEEAKKLARTRAPIASSDAPRAGETTEAMRQLMGDDPWPYGLEANRTPLATFLEAATEQGLITSPMTVEDLFSSELPDSHQ